jgi:hypothetical protein
MSVSFALFISQLTIDLGFYYLVTFCFMGILLNLIGIVVFSRKKLRSMTMSFYHIVLASVNNAAICVQFLYYIPLFYGQNMLVWSQSSCVLLNYFQRFLISFSSWIDMMIAIDRTIFILYKGRFGFIYNRKIIFGIMLGILSFIVAVNWQMTRYIIFRGFFLKTLFN